MPELVIWTYRCTRDCFYWKQRWRAGILYDFEKRLQGRMASHFELVTEPPRRRRILGIPISDDQQQENLETMAKTRPEDRARLVIGARTQGMMPYPERGVIYHPAKPRRPGYDRATSSLDEDMPI